MSEGRERSWLVTVINTGLAIVNTGVGVIGLGVGIIGLGFTIFCYLKGQEKQQSASYPQAPVPQPPTEALNPTPVRESEIIPPVPQPPTEASNPTPVRESEIPLPVPESHAQNTVPLAAPQRPTPKLPYLYRQRGRLDQGGVVYLRTPDPPTEENHGKQLEEKYRDQLLENGRFSATMTTLAGALNEGQQIYHALENRGIPVTIDEFPDQQPTYMAGYCCVLYYVPENQGFAATLAGEFTKITGLNFVAEPGNNPPKDPSMRLVVQCLPRQ